MRLRSIVFCYRDYLTKRPRNNTTRLLAISSTHHCVSLTTPSLTIGENGAIVSIKYILDERKRTLLIDVTL